MNVTPLRILIVDDYVDNARMLKTLVKHGGHDACITFDGPTAIAAASLQKPDVVLLDLNLPGMSGIDVAAELRRNPEQAGCVLVAISGHDKESVPSPSPFDRHFIKPVDIVALLDYLSEIQAGQKPQAWTPAVAC
jgi:two-component system, sensor histidine kinase